MQFQTYTSVTFSINIASYQNQAYFRLALHDASLRFSQGKGEQKVTEMCHSVTVSDLLVTCNIKLNQLH